MDPLIGGALEIWSPPWLIVLLIVSIGWLYLRGWQRIRRLIVTTADTNRLLAFLGGLAALLLALASPLDALDSLFLSAHMAQHLLLLMVAPPLLLLGQPTVPLLRGLPKTFVKEGLGPFLTWHPLRLLAQALTFPPLAWLLFAVSTLLWHMPALYELALRTPFWHGMQHACFFWSGILFWWPVIRQGPARPRWPEWTLIPYLLFADIVNTALSAFFIFSGTVLYPSYQTLRVGGFTPQDDQSLAGAIMWVPGSIVYLLPAIVFAMRMLGPARTGSSPRQVVVLRRNTTMPRTVHRSARRLPALRRVSQVALLLVAIAVIADGLRGPQIAPLNLAGVLPWIHWRALSLVALLTLGNLFCMACPFVLARDIARKVLPARWRWPHWLRNKWLPAALLLLYLWAYEGLGLWNRPAATAWIIIAYFAAALAVDGLFRGASFCKYVCPIGQFHFVTSLVSPREVRVRKQSVCESCQTHDCIRGSATARGCELYLFQPKKAGNLDCTFCLDCVKACPHDNVALLPILPGATLLKDDYRSSIGRLAKRTDYAAVALLIVFGGFVNAAGMTGRVMMWEHGWHAQLGHWFGHWLGGYGMQLAVAAFTLAGAVALPLSLVAACAALNRLVTLTARYWDVTRRFVFAMVPLGVAMWAAHLLYHFGTSWAAAIPALQRVAHKPLSVSAALVPAWLTPAQIILLDGGVLLALYLAWRLAEQVTQRFARALAVWTPWAVTLLALYAVGVWIVLQPMDMRGMTQ